MIHAGGGMPVPGALGLSSGRLRWLGMVGTVWAREPPNERRVQRRQVSLGLGHGRAAGSNVRRRGGRRGGAVVDELLIRQCRSLRPCLLEAGGTEGVEGAADGALVNVSAGRKEVAVAGSSPECLGCGGEMDDFSWCAVAWSAASSPGMATMTAKGSPLSWARWMARRAWSRAPSGPWVWLRSTRLVSALDSHSGHGTLRARTRAWLALATELVVGGGGHECEVDGFAEESAVHVFVAVRRARDRAVLPWCRGRPRGRIARDLAHISK